MMGELLLQGGGVQLLVAFAGGSGKLEEQQPEDEEELCTTNSSSSSHWYFTKDQIDNNSPSRRDGIDLKKENYLRKSYCTFLQDLGMRLKEPQLTIATAIVFCHRFFLRQSHHKNDCHLIATVCMFLAGKVEDSPRPLQDVILMSYEIRFKKDPIAVQKIKQKHVFEAEKERVLLGEWLVLTTLGFDFNVHHPYKPLGATLRKLGMAKHPLAQVAWNFVNDGLRTSLCLQYKPHHVAAGAIFLATKFLKIKLTSEGDKLWWQEFEVTPRQLEDVSNQMLELYEQDKKGISSRMSDPSSSTGPNTPKKGRASTDLPDVAGCPCPVLPPGQMKPELLEDKKKYSKIVEAVTGDVTEAHSSLEEGENVAESKPATFEIPGTAAFLTNTSRTSSKGQHSAVKVSKVVLRPTEKSLKQTPVYRDKLNMDVREGTGKPCRARGEVPLDTYPLMKPTNEEGLLGQQLKGEEETATNPVLQERKVKVISKIVHNLPGTLQMQH